MENSGREVEETVKNNQEVEAEVTKACSCSTFFASGGKIFYKSWLHSKVVKAIHLKNEIQNKILNK